MVTKREVTTRLTVTIGEMVMGLREFQARLDEMALYSRQPHPRYVEALHAPEVMEDEDPHIGSESQRRE